ncbi:DEAD/DEAH box helicase [Candidatus Campbellbacteria bacterium]|nr:DEAD/DEAH box helicase [Candidatus Campbellbacteria bacterium]|tara:strand:- start:6964 stop:8490 length:1527 start_codon:yes stop_codon:yes gene_type:complete
MKFKDFKFKSRLAYAINRAGFEEPSPIQEKSIPLILEGKDMVGQAHTGTGKTAAFALPILQKTTKSMGVNAVVIVPTRELATQVADEFYKFSRNLGIRTATVYGGTSYKRQINHIENAGVIVATPGRFLDLLSRNKIDIDPYYVVLDEADEMLNMGFLEDIRRILDHLKDRKQTLMFSATMPDEIKELADTILKNPEFIRTEKAEITNNNIKQYYYVVDEHERDDAIVRLIEYADPDKAIVFCRTKRETGRLAEYLAGQGYKTAALHGDMEQWDRQKTMKSFRRNEYEILVATDVAARGLDVRGVSHVFNYQIPMESESYVHRIGRTGRAKRDGVAMMLVSPQELRELERIKADVGSELELQSIPQKNSSPEERLKELFQMVASQRANKAGEVIVDAMTEKTDVKTVAVKLALLLEKTLRQDGGIGKSADEVKKLLEKGDSDDNKKSSRSSNRGRSNSRNNRSRSSSSRGRHARSSQRIRRGTGRGQVPEPQFKKTSGGSRIIARKLY